jgi:hypothetical protein
MSRISLSLAAFCLLLPSCSLLFDPSASDQAGDDAGVPNDADLDAGSLCDNSRVLESGAGLLELNRGQILDVDRDGLDDVLLISEESGRPTEVYVTFGHCPPARPWEYQQRWMLEEPTGVALTPHVLAVAEGRMEQHRLVAISERGTVPWVTTYPLTGGVPAMDADFSAEIPAHNSNGECRDASAPLYLMSGNFDDDSDPTRNDLAFFAGQGWTYSVGQWGNAPAWDFSCEAGVETGSNPEQFAGPGERYGFMPVENPGTVTDEFVDARDNRLYWYSEDDRHSPRSWPNGVEVDGVALSRAATVDDGKPDAVGWEPQGSLLDLYIAALFNDVSGGNFTMASYTIDIGGIPPTAGAVVELGEVRGLLLLSGTSLYLMTIDTAPASPDAQALGFEPKFMLLPNWGENTILVFNSDDAVFECYQISSSAEFVACPGR